MPIAPGSTTTMYVIQEKIAIRDKAQIGGKIIGNLKKNEKITVFVETIKSTSGGFKWKKILIDEKKEKTGYITSEYISTKTAFIGANKVNDKGEKEPNEKVSDKDKTTQELKEKQTTAPGDTVTTTTMPTDDDVNMYSDTPYTSYEGFSSGDRLSDEYNVNPFEIDDLLTDNIVGIYGMPYQFMPTVDIRLKNKKDVGPANQAGIGRKYAEKIVSTMPLLLLTPGVPKFLKNYTNEEREGILNRLLDYFGSKSTIKTEINDIINKPGRYYSFDFNYAQYFNYVESLLWAGAKFMGIENEKVTIGNLSGKLGDFKWRSATNSKLSQYISGKQYIPFYIESIDSVNESFSTETGQSSLAGSLNNLADLSREVQFITGNYTNHTVGIQNMEDYNSAMKSLDNLLSNSIFKKSKFINSIADSAATIAAGGKLYFPEIWNDTTYTKSYDINIKLRTPDGDMLSWFLNIFVPLIHLICMAAPRELKNPNMYLSPFLVRAYYKGAISCDMGIITSLDINKGKEGSWTLDGLPTEVDINMNLKDLYNVFSISDAMYSTSQFVKNIGMIDYLASTCGISINKPELTRSIELYFMLKGSIYGTGLNRTWSYISQGFDRFLTNILYKFDVGSSK